MTRVVVDHQIFTGQRFGGISRMFSEIISHCHAQGQVRVSLPVAFTRNHYLRSSTWRRYLPGRLSVVNPRVERALLRLPFDVFHPTYYRDYFSSRLGGRPFVLTVVDMIPELFPSLWRTSPHLDKNELLPKAAAVIAISESTRRDILRFAALPEDRISVVHPGGPRPGPPHGAAPKLPEAFLLFVGARRRYKNFGLFAVAAAQLMASRSSLYLVCAGGGPLQPEELAPFSRAGCAGRVLWLSPSDRDLAWLYYRARAFVFPSLSEGFGLPLLEAFARRCPVAASSTPCFHEVAAEAAVFFDPADVDDISASLEVILDDEENRERLCRSGLSRLRDFSWARAAEKITEVYRRVASG